MSKSGLSKAFEYHCGGCEYGGNCPGHTVQAQFDRSMDIYTFYIDGKPQEYFGDDQWIAMCKAVDAIE